MFESDDFDQVLSQFDLPGISNTANELAQLECKVQSGTQDNAKENSANLSISQHNNHTAITSKHPSQTHSENKYKDNKISTVDVQTVNYRNDDNKTPNVQAVNFVSPKHTKRKIIRSHFDHNSKRKFPGPAGLLTGTFQESRDDTISHMELLSQDIENSQNMLRRDLFESPLWQRLLEDINSCDLHDIDSIKMIKQQALTGNLQRRKAQTVTAFVETVDRSVTDPLVILRDPTGNIKCTLHRDAWSTFSPYLVSEYCALVLWKPTVLTTGSAFKKHYLNITLSNIYAIYSSAVLNDEEIILPESHNKVAHEDFTVIRLKITPQEFGTNQITSEENLLEDLDTIFSDDLF